MAQAPGWVSSYRRIPYKELNCWDLVGKILWDRAQIKLPDFAGEYERDAIDPDWEFRLPEQVDALTSRERVNDAMWVKAVDPQELDVALYWAVVKNTAGQYVKMNCHVGIAVSQTHGLSTDLAHGSYLYPLRSQKFAGKLEGYFRHVSRSRTR